MPGNCEAACRCMQKHGPKATALDSIPFVDCPRASQGKSGDDVWHFTPKGSAVDRVKHGDLGTSTSTDTKHCMAGFVEELAAIKAQDGVAAKAAKEKDFDCHARKAHVLRGHAHKHWCNKVLTRRGVPHSIEHWEQQKWIQPIEEV